METLLQPQQAGKVSGSSVYKVDSDTWAVRLFASDVYFRWETDPEYCTTIKKTAPYDKGTRLVDFIDMVILDFLMSRFKFPLIH